MKQEDKDLLMLDLSGRLLFNVVCKIGQDEETLQNNYITEVLSISGYKAFVDTMNCSATVPFFVKPYLRQLSSMTKEEYEEYEKIEYGMSNIGSKYRYYDLCDWYNKHHFDYRGLIEKGLAVEAPEDMYKPKKS